MSNRLWFNPSPRKCRPQRNAKSPLLHLVRSPEWTPTFTRPFTYYGETYVAAEAAEASEAAEEGADVF